MVDIDMVDMDTWAFFYPSQPWLLPSHTPVEDTIQPFSSISTLHNMFRHSGHGHMSLFIEYEQNLQAQILLSYWKVKVKSEILTKWCRGTLLDEENICLRAGHPPNYNLTKDPQKSVATYWGPPSVYASIKLRSHPPEIKTNMANCA